MTLGLISEGGGAGEGGNCRLEDKLFYFCKSIFTPPLAMSHCA